MSLRHLIFTISVVLVATGITAVIRSAGVFTTRIRGYLTIRESYAVVSLTWIAVGLVGALPYLLTGVLENPVAAVFESVSGFTTTGATVFADIEALAHGILILALAHAVARGNGDHPARRCDPPLPRRRGDAPLSRGGARAHPRAPVAPNPGDRNAPLVRLCGAHRLPRSFPPPRGDGGLRCNVARLRHDADWRVLDPERIDRSLRLPLHRVYPDRLHVPRGGELRAPLPGLLRPPEPLPR